MKINILIVLLIISFPIIHTPHNTVTEPQLEQRYYPTVENIVYVPQPTISKQIPTLETVEELIPLRTAAGLTEGESYSMRIYHYCSCRWCTPGEGVTASGKRVAKGMVAMYGLPFGTIIEINNQRFTVEDRGVGAYKVDIYVDSHREAIEKGTYKAEVKIIYIP